jgi:F0F1-type ATP synthase assembly protein I
VITILVAAATGLLFSARASLIFWVLGSSLAATICIATAIAGWSPQALMDAILGILAYNITFGAGVAARVYALRGPAAAVRGVKPAR